MPNTNTVKIPLKGKKLRQYILYEEAEIYFLFNMKLLSIMIGKWSLPRFGWSGSLFACSAYMFCMQIEPLLPNLMRLHCRIEKKTLGGRLLFDLTFSVRAVTTGSRSTRRQDDRSLHPCLHPTSGESLRSVRLAHSVRKPSTLPTMFRCRNSTKLLQNRKR